MQARATALQTFYSSDAWRAHARAANETMVSIDDVYLLRAAGVRMQLRSDRPAIGSAEPARAGFSVEIFPPSAAVEIERCARADAAVVATYVTEKSPNNFPALPVRADRVVVVIRRLGAGSLPAACGWTPRRALTLVPTSRSLLR